ncbi:MAG: Mut7-C RNAse domain-containing protein [Candidatus Micrarchaeota archaeon]
MRFVCDAMLCRLCLWLRMSGQECTFSNSSNDDVIKLAAKEDAVLLTRNKKLFQKAADYCKVQLLCSHDYLGQLREVVICNKIKLKFSQRFCTICGGKLKKVSKKSVEGKVWPFTYKTHKNFLQCVKCKHIFWRGSHWKKIKSTLAAITT